MRHGSLQLQPRRVYRAGRACVIDIHMLLWIKSNVQQQQTHSSGKKDSFTAATALYNKVRARSPT